LVRAYVKELLGGASTTPTTGSMYRVRKAWGDAATQKGAFSVLDNAKKCADQNPGYTVFDALGNAVYPTAAAPALKSVDEIAREVIAGKWGNGQDRKNRLTAAVQARRNSQRLLSGYIQKSPL